MLKTLEQRVDAQNDEESQDEHSAADAAAPTSFTDKELQKHYEERNMSSERTQWVDMCFTSVALTLVAILQKVRITVFTIVNPRLSICHYVNEYLAYRDGHFCFSFSSYLHDVL